MYIFGSNLHKLIGIFTVISMIIYCKIQIEHFRKAFTIFKPIFWAAGIRLFVEFSPLIEMNILKAWYRMFVQLHSVMISYDQLRLITRPMLENSRTIIFRTFFSILWNDGLMYTYLPPWVSFQIKILKPPVKIQTNTWDHPRALMRIDRTSS